MHYYTWYHVRGRAILADDFEAHDPFSLAPGDIVDRVVAAGFTPAIDSPLSKALPPIGTVTEVERKGLSYLVSISRDAEEIDVQERRDEAYEQVE
jgi:hypothetical protein